ncbi:thioredoxin-disulfide reductase [Candidatus Izimaplasma bacterium ZiA1]|uniref:NAD(P)/FAD-dependent oxidoreductase n=1 Tax=Candidatus Izimoplasma sp. ZiA1 TaxID=2024899 RepID=UPI000BAA5BDA|nr:thioredoxin-disulfide reductase [Candidatus Izimaplasma bacterium ZiA1]
MEKYDVIIIGAGPGGMTAAIYAVRANLKTVMLEKAAPGGKMLSTWEVENYAGLGKVSGFDISEKMFNHTQELGVEYKYGDIANIVDKGEYKEVIDSSGNVYQAKTVIIGSGTVPRSLGVEGESKLNGRGISWCAVCDGAFFKGKDVVVVGGGNSAIEEAVYLSSMVNKITVVNILDTLQADPKAIDQANATGKISYKLGYEINSFNGDTKLESVTITNAKTKEVEEITTDGAFIFIGHIPETTFAKELGITDKWGYIKTDEKMETSVPGIFGIGDVIVKQLRQIVTASSDGAIAAQAAAKYIEEHK